MAYEGYVDVLNDRQIAGWVYDNASPAQVLTVEVLAGDRVVATIAADHYRPDLQAAGKGTGWIGFSYRAPADAALGAPLAARIVGKRWRIQPTTAATGQPPPLHQDPRRRYLHTLEFGYPDVQTGFTTARSSADEAAIVERLIQAYHRAVKDDPDANARKADMWSEIQAQMHGEALELLRARDAAGLAAYLREAHAKGLTWGITQGPEMTAALRSGAAHRRNIATEYIDNLASLAEFLGVLEVESPLQRGKWGENIQSDPQVLADQVAAKVGFPIETPPAIGSYFGLQTRGGIVTGRDLCSLYAALQIRNLAANLGIDEPAVCEIGGGMGGVAYYCARMGIDFTIVDLPLVSLLQGYFLLRALPKAKIQLYGEAESSASAVRLLPTFQFAAPGRNFDILFNQDSFPEMNAAYSVGYLTQARTNVGHAIYSINQEARAPQAGTERQTTVRELVEKAGGVFRLSSRDRHWLRAGYVEETYKKGR